MKIVDVQELQALLPSLERLLGDEPEVVITRNGKPIARMVPATQQENIPSRADLRRSIQTLTVGSEVLIRQERDER